MFTVAHDNPFCGSCGGLLYIIILFDMQGYFVSLMMSMGCLFCRRGVSARSGVELHIYKINS